MDLDLDGSNYAHCKLMASVGTEDLFVKKQGLTPRL